MKILNSEIKFSIIVLILLKQRTIKNYIKTKKKKEYLNLPIGSTQKAVFSKQIWTFSKEFNASWLICLDTECVKSSWVKWAKFLKI